MKNKLNCSSKLNKNTKTLVVSKRFLLTVLVLLVTGFLSFTSFACADKKVKQQDKKNINTALEAFRKDVKKKGEKSGHQVVVKVYGTKVLSLKEFLKKYVNKEQLPKKIQDISALRVVEIDAKIIALDVVADLESNAPEEAIQDFHKELQAWSELKEIKYVSKDEMLEKLKSVKSPEEIERLKNMGNPLPPSFEITVKEANNVEKIVKKLEEQTIVRSVRKDILRLHVFCFFSKGKMHYGPIYVTPSGEPIGRPS